MRTQAFDLDRTLRRIYYDARNPASYSSVNKLYRACRLENPTVTLQSVKDWLAGERVYSLHKPARKTFKRNRSIVSRVDEQWQADLVDMQVYSSSNRGCRYLLTVIDMFSKFAFVVPLKNKEGSTLKVAFKDIFATGRVPEKLQTDEGTEFENRILGPYLHSMGVRHFTTKNRQIKCAMVERFNRTLKGRLYKYMTARRTQSYLGILDDIVDSYNRTKHSVTKMRPVDVDVDDKHDKEVVFKNTYGFTNLRDLILYKIERDKRSVPALKVGDLVRLAKLRKTFQRGFKSSWTKSVFKVKRVILRMDKPVYELADRSAHVLKKKFYLDELQKVTQNMLNAARVLETKNVNGRVRHLVQWTADAPEDTCWIDDADMRA